MDIGGVLYGRKRPGELWTKLCHLLMLQSLPKPVQTLGTGVHSANISHECGCTIATNTQLEYGSCDVQKTHVEYQWNIVEMQVNTLDYL